MLLHQLAERTAAELPDKLALVADGQRLTWEELERRAAGLAAGLQARGIGRGERVATLLDNGVEAVVALLATSKIGAVHMPLSALTKADKLAYLLKDARASALITHSSLASVFDAVLPTCSTVRLSVVAGAPPAAHDSRRIGFDELACSARALRAVTLIDRDLAALVYTSGSTGQPKGVMLTHRNVVSATDSICGYLGARADDVILCVLPVAFNYGLSQLLIAFRTGAAVVLERSFAFPVQVLEAAARERATMFPAVPTVFSVLFGLQSLGRYDLSSLRIVTNAGAALPEEHVRQIRRRFPQAQLVPMYGQTECIRVTYLDPGEVDRRPGSVGRGMPNQELWLVDQRGERLPDDGSRGHTGELVIRGSHVMLGYWERPEETARKLRPGPLPGESVLYSGDLFRRDDDGFYWFVARLDDIIKSRGEKVSPREVENTLYALDGVLEAAVIGVPDALLGQAVKAFVVLRPGVSYGQRDVIRHCLGRLESFMVPKVVEFRQSLPKTDNGKIRKTELA